MPLPLKDRKIGAVEYVIKKLKGSDTYDKMKDHNEYGSERMIQRDKPESDNNLGMKQSVQDLMTALETKDASSFESSLRTFVALMIDSKEDEEELLKKDND